MTGGTTEPSRNPKHDLEDGIESLVEFAASLDLASVPERVVDHARTALLDFLSLAVSGTKSEAARIARDMVLEFGGSHQARAIGYGDRTSLAGAAMIGGIASHVDDFDDTHASTILHPTSPVLGAAFPVAELQRSSGQELLEAYIIGVEVASRLALALGRAHYLRGWHVTGTAGVVGAAAAAGRLLKLDQAELGNALGLAATGAGGHREQFGYMSKSLHPGRAAADGVISAVLSAKGFTASPTSFGGRRGMFAVMGEGSNHTSLVKGLGQIWELDDVGFKPYSCGVVTHAAIDAVIALRNDHHTRPQDIEHLKFRVHPLVGELTGKVLPTTGLEGKFSVGYVCAIALVDGAVLPSMFEDDRMTEPTLIDLQNRMEFITDGGLKECEAAVYARLRDGSEVEHVIGVALGSPGRRMTREEVERKSEQLVAPLLGSARAMDLRDYCRDSEHLRTIDSLVEATIPA